MDYLAANWLEVIGVVSGLLCVLLLIKQNALTFPLGLLYALVTVIVVARSNLYAKFGDQQHHQYPYAEHSEEV